MFVNNNGEISEVKFAALNIHAQELSKIQHTPKQVPGKLSGRPNSKKFSRQSSQVTCK